MSVIQQNSGEFAAFCLKQLELKGKFSFSSSSLGNLVGLATYEGHAEHDNWTQHSKYAGMDENVKDGHNLDLLTDKGNYPCDYE